MSPPSKRGRRRSKKKIDRRGRRSGDGRRKIYIFIGIKLRFRRMRIKEPVRKFFVEEVGKIDPKAEVYLFGSRTDDEARGGDIDILILSEERLPISSVRVLRREFFKSFGWQKLDLVNFLFNEDDPFRNLIEKQLIRL